MTKIDYVILEEGLVTVKYKSGKVVTYGRGTTRVIPDTVDKFIDKSCNKGFMYCTSDTCAIFRNWER